MGVAVWPRYATNLAWPFFVVMGFFKVFVLSRLLKLVAERCARRRVENPEELIPKRGCVRCLYTRLERLLGKQGEYAPAVQLGYYWPVRARDLWNVQLIFLQLIFIIMTKAALACFTFQANPRGPRTLSRFPEVQKGSPEWKSIIPLSVLGIIVYTVGVLTLVIYIVIVAPRRVSSDYNFYRTFRCLWEKYDPNTWWFSVVQLIFGFGLNVVPILAEMSTHQITNVIGLCFLYVLIVSRIRPWKFRLNHITDIVTKMGLAFFVMFSMNVSDLRADVARESEDVFTVLMYLSIGLPVCFVLLEIVFFLWLHNVAKVHALKRRMHFSQRLHDIVKIVGARSSLELRAFAMSLLDNQVHHLNEALDVLQFTLLGLQPTNRLKRYCANVPFEVAVDGRLEGELRALGLESAGDARMLLRRLKRGLRQSNFGSTDTLDAAEGEVPSHTLAKRKRRRLRHASSNLGRQVATVGVSKGVEEKVKKTFRKLNNGDGDVDEAAFVRVLREHFQIASKGAPPPFTDAELAEVFRHVDADSSQALSLEELAHALQFVPDPVLPRWCSMAASGESEDTQSVSLSACTSECSTLRHTRASQVRVDQAQGDLSVSMNLLPGDRSELLEAQTGESSGLGFQLAERVHDQRRVPEAKQTILQRELEGEQHMHGHSVEDLEADWDPPACLEADNVMQERTAEESAKAVRTCKLSEQRLEELQSRMIEHHGTTQRLLQGMVEAAVEASAANTSRTFGQGQQPGPCSA
eukprot:CAMPEP_0168429174 /NCGR_PEP_ID=MMETSP0228-20121227/37237_1 /TAXON_ID=133427 /ORGANISM="Protoceratium reticulatum, Strain CCCM 535 (=CCMP 1889)" /LENGTH=748 /DNA_ID=CAMNT_0008443257 /DNA_START=175 /DNA_END=2419 /DNA_ORIENTATION=-